MTINKLYLTVILLGIGLIIHGINCIYLKSDIRNIHTRLDEIENSRQSSQILVQEPPIISVDNYFPEGTRIIAEIINGFTVTHETYFVKDGKLTKVNPI